MLTRVVNLATGAERFYSLMPEDAVKAAYLQDKGDHSTWLYSKRYVHIVRGRWSVSAGDWAALWSEDQRAPFPDGVSRL